MYKKISVIVVIFFILFLILNLNALSNKTAEKEYSKGLNLRTIFAASPLISIKHERIEEYVIPNNQVIEIPLRTYYSLVGVFAIWQESKLKDTIILIELSIVDQPDWCDASIVESIVQLKMDHTEPFISTLSVTVNENAPAFTQGVVRVKAESKEISGLFFTRVTEGAEIFDIPFQVGYLPVLNIETEKTFLEITHLNVTNIPIKLENIGNGKTNVIIEIKDGPEKWNFTYPKSIALGSLALGQKNEGVVNIVIRPSGYFSRENITISFTPTYLGRPDLKGQTTTLNFVLKNDSSLKKEAGADIILPIVIVIAIAVTIIGLLINNFKKKNL